MEHPKRFTKNQCLAFSKDRRRCRLERDTENKRTCHIHRNYYNNWFSTNNYLFPIILCKRKINEIVFQYNYVHNADDIKKNISNLLHYHLRFYEFIIMNTNADPLWNSTLFKDLIEDSIINKKNINYLLKSPEACKFVFNTLIELTVIGNLIITDYDSNYLRFWDDYFVNVPGWIQMLGSTFFMEECQKCITKAKKDNNRRVINTIEVIVLPAIMIFKENSLHKQKYSLVYKEELMMVTWHPSRIEKWLNDGGFDMLHMMMGH